MKFETKLRRLYEIGYSSEALQSLRRQHPEVSTTQFLEINHQIWSEKNEQLKNEIAELDKEIAQILDEDPNEGDRGSYADQEADYS